MEAGDRKRIFELLLRATRTKARFAALLSVHTNEIRGQFALGDPAFDTRGVTELRIPRNSVPNLEKAIASGKPSIASLATGEPFIDGYLDGVLGRPRSHLLLPIEIGRPHGRSHCGPSRRLADEARGRHGSPDPVLGDGRGAGARARDARPRGDDDDGGADREGADGQRRATTATRSRSRSRYRMSRARRKQDRGASRSRGVEGAGRKQIRELVRDGMETGEPGEDEQLELLLELGNVEAEKLGRAGPRDRGVEERADDRRGRSARHRCARARVRAAGPVGGVRRRAREEGGARRRNVAARIHALLELGAIARERLDDDERAIGAYERILSLDSGHARGEQGARVALYGSQALGGPDRAACSIARRATTIRRARRGADVGRAPVRGEGRRRPRRIPRVADRVPARAGAAASHRAARAARRQREPPARGRGGDADARRRARGGSTRRSRPDCGSCSARGSAIAWAIAMRRRGVRSGRAPRSRGDRRGRGSSCAPTSGGPSWRRCSCAASRRDGREASARSCAASSASCTRRRSASPARRSAGSSARTITIRTTPAPLVALHRLYLESAGLGCARRAAAAS